jgi:hypothetical protein
VSPVAGGTHHSPFAHTDTSLSSINDPFTDAIQLNTSEVATETIDYVATDQSGLAATSTRTVIIQAANDSTPPLASTTTTPPSTQ